MSPIETISTKVRHLPGLKHLSLLWSLVRPLYQRFVTLSAGTGGLVRVINGMDEIRILPEYRALPEVYEPEVWKLLLPQVRPGDCIADIGAHYGLYAMAFAKRTGASGCVLAVEADPRNAVILRAHAELNQVQDVVQVIQQALSDREGEAEWHSQDMQSVAKPSDGSGSGPTVKMTTLDHLSGGRRVDLVLVDIEGYEEPALRGGEKLLRDPNRRPRLIMIEVHPYNWPLCGGSSDSLLRFLNDCGYAVTTLSGQPVTEVKEYGHIMAVPALG